MKYVDFEKISGNFEKFWNHEYFGRCAIRLTAPKKPVKLPEHSDNEDIMKYWCDGEFLLNRSRILSENNYYLGEAFPFFFLNFGAGGNAGYFKNARYQFTDRTVWFFPIDENEKLVFSKDTYLYKATINLAKYFVENSNDEFIIGMPGCSSNIDALAHLRGSEQVLLNMIDNPGLLKEELEIIQQSWLAIVNDIFAITKKNNHGGGSTWMGTWAKGLHAQLQSDISVMLSPQQFAEFVYPDLNRQCEILEYPNYHLDGLEQLRHLDKLVSIKNLRLIQYTFCDGQPSPVEQIPALQRIQKTGKLLLLMVPPQYVKPLLENLSAKGLFITTACRNPEEADGLFRIVKEYSREQRAESK